MKKNLRLMKACVATGMALSTALTLNAFAATAASAANSSVWHANFQQKDVQGTVKDKSGAVLPGVTVLIKGSTKGTSVGADGKFSIAAKPGDVLVFRFVGYAPKEVTVGSSDHLQVVLEESATGLNELVVTALGIKKEEKSIGYAMTKVKGSEFTQAREINVANALVGKIAGVNSSAPATGAGGSSRVTIRGNSSLSYNNQPLYVVNGIPISNDNQGNPSKFGGADYGDGISSINPDDIEDMTVLKGGAAAALYGQRGINGVILITTKSGKSRKGLGIEVNSNITIDKVQDFRDFQREYGQGTLGKRPTNAASGKATGLQSWGEKLDGQNAFFFDGKEHPYVDQSQHNFKDFYKTGTTLSNTVAFSGGNENTTFRVSLGDLRNQSVYPNAYYKRTNANIDLSFKLNDKWSGQANVTYIKERANRTNVSDAPANGNFGIMFLPPNVRANMLDNPAWDPNTGIETEYNNNQYNTNPYFAAGKVKNLTDKDRVMGMASLRYQALEWLYIQGRVTNDFFAFNANSIWPSGIAFKPTGKLVQDLTRNMNELNTDIMVGINKKLAKDFNLGFTAGGNFMRTNGKSIDMNADGLAYRDIYNPSTAANRVVNVQTPLKEVHSVYGSLELSYKSTIFLNVTDRNDWSSTLPIKNNSYNYPSINAAYVFSETLNLPWLNFGKIRAGYSQVGGDAPIFSTDLYYNAQGTINNAPISDLPVEIPNANLQPLKVKETEVGAQLGFLKNRISLDFAWYKKQTLNDIVAGTVSITSGYERRLVNVGKIENKGIELLLTVVPVKTRDFTWTTSFNYTKNNNKVLELAPGQTDMQIDESRTEAAYIKHVVGKPVSQVVAFDYMKDGNGNLILNGDGLPQRANTLSAFGTGVAPTSGGWNNEFNYKRFGLSFLIDFKSGAVIYSATNSTAYGVGLHKETLAGREGGVNVTGVDADGKPVSKNVTAQNYYNAVAGISAVHVYNADFIKFRSISLTYNFPASAFNNKIGGLSLSLVGRNLFYISKHTPNIDPESSYTSGNAQGLEYAVVPPTRQLGLNLNVKF
ncbi:SusC/RagA family TonB-linked outer membrane protein [Chitinophaga solisilvae]|uniref:SusC/RagA family TonB-linked outer membrane protein n=1 Tax=Chitinophaga solisilvae TaxID=1233460 RepID=A0A3S1BL75_9BACT|nr:SusC/RagA family TonB-linked outer membrane protein [Chitinophaga solisilvae]NSL90476.1 SusC/RagA family TonB-linked outer membrane protein [Chitinophaga solisilvae]